MTEPTDEQVEQFIETHPHGATLDELCPYFGNITRQRAQQLVSTSVAKLLRALRARGIRSTDDLLGC